MVKGIEYTPAFLAELTRCLSPDRLATYQAATATPQAALELYAWNSAISAALYVPLQGLEITVRNAFHQALAPVYGPSWYDNPQARLTPAALARVAEAKQKLQTTGKPITPGGVIAELSFGFWERLLSRGPRGNQNYEVTLWRPALHRAFPNARRPRSMVHAPFPVLRDLRNRIAHHEHIFTRNLVADYQTVLDVIGWMSADMQGWVMLQSQVPAVLAARP